MLSSRSHRLGRPIALHRRRGDLLTGTFRMDVSLRLPEKKTLPPAAPVPPGLRKVTLSEAAAQQMQVILDDPNYPTHAGKDLAEADPSVLHAMAPLSSEKIDAIWERVMETEPELVSDLETSPSDKKDNVDP